ncbi:Acyltransferase [Mucilaginibacter pineti]|uniref:Acyltransferase n=1 Tax=Mucilaginibacter pineti TaxID=1391627 RepID=A0A1G7DW38_9SPHI|nr:1-acyl-sn-glycerol-3-phosphate acyltransferase [Mucilaginibacter pineti]SDE55684.1 Acyltransferase [Mucilaginibacter pineti]
MVHNKSNFFISPVIRFYLKRLVKRHFNELLFNTISTDNNKAILLIGNHFSFWDSVILYTVNDVLFKKKFHVMMLEETDREQPFLKYAGAFTINKNSRDIIQSLDYAAKLLKDPRNMVLIFPQGRLFPNFTNTIRFQKGISRIINNAAADFQLIFAATFIQHFKHLKPTATVYLKSEAVNYANKDVSILQKSYQEHYNGARHLQTETEFDI